MVFMVNGGLVIKLIYVHKESVIMHCYILAQWKYWATCDSGWGECGPYWWAMMERSRSELKSRVHKFICGFLFKMLYIVPCAISLFVTSKGCVAFWGLVKHQHYWLSFTYLFVTSYCICIVSHVVRTEYCNFLRIIMKISFTAISFLQPRWKLKRHSCINITRYCKLRFRLSLFLSSLLWRSSDSLQYDNSIGLDSRSIDYCTWLSLPSLSSVFHHPHALRTRFTLSINWKTMWGGGDKWRN